MSRLDNIQLISAVDCEPQSPLTLEEDDLFSAPQSPSEVVDMKRYRHIDHSRVRGSKSDSLNAQLMLFEGRIKFVLSAASSFIPSSPYDIVRQEDIEYVILPISQDRQETTCSVCLSEMIAPRLTSCGHLFCLMCIHTAQKFSAQCPTCHQPVSLAHLTPIIWKPDESMNFDLSVFISREEIDLAPRFPPLYLFRNTGAYPVCVHEDNIEYRRFLWDTIDPQIPTSCSVTALDYLSILHSLREDVSTRSLDEKLLLIYAECITSLSNRLDQQQHNRRPKTIIKNVITELQQFMAGFVPGSEADEGEPLSIYKVHLTKTLEQLLVRGEIDRFVPSYNMDATIWQCPYLLPMLLQLFPNSHGQDLNMKLSQLLPIMNPELCFGPIRIIGTDIISNHDEGESRDCADKLFNTNAKTHVELYPVLDSHQLEYVNKFLRKKLRIEQLLTLYSYRSIPDTSDFTTTLYRTTLAPIVLEAYLRFIARRIVEIDTEVCKELQHDKFHKFLEKHWPPKHEDIECYMPTRLYPLAIELLPKDYEPSHYPQVHIIPVCAQERVHSPHEYRAMLPHLKCDCPARKWLIIEGHGENNTFVSHATRVVLNDMLRKAHDARLNDVEVHCRDRRKEHERKTGDTSDNIERLFGTVANMRLQQLDTPSNRSNIDNDEEFPSLG